jgi:hypothetical protein
MFGIELTTVPPAAATRASKSGGVFPFNKKTCRPGAAVAVRDSVGVKTRSAGVVGIASRQAAASTRTEIALLNRRSARPLFDIFDLFKRDPNVNAWIGASR